MSVTTHNLTPQYAIGVIAVNALALIAFACSPYGAEYPLAGVGIVAFILVQLFCPACRICFAAPLSPANIAQGFFWIQLVLVTLLIGFFGFALGTLPRLPSRESLYVAMFVHVLAYVAFSVAYQYFSAPATEAESPVDLEPTNDARPTEASLAYLVVPFLCLGLLGFVFTYGSLGGFVDFISSPANQKLSADEPTTPEGAAGTFLRHFLGFAVVLAWSWWLGRSARPRSLVICGAVTVVVLALLMLANFSYNRGSMLAPLLAVAAAFSIHVRRMPFRAVLLAGAAVLVAAFAFGWYRSTDMDIGNVSASDLHETIDGDKMVEFVQIYASAPQLSGYLIEEVDLDGQFFHGRTLVPSVVYPIPVLGAPYRESSGVAIFNHMIYGDADFRDQIIPLDAELYMNFHIPGVLLGYALLGWLLSWFQSRFLTARQPIESYAWLMLALWTIFPGSLPVISQMYVYAFWPIYLYMAAKIVGVWRVVAAPPPCIENSVP